jgi:hypothetical protein
MVRDTKEDRSGTSSTRRAVRREARDVLRAGLQTARWINVDDTGARHQASNGVCTHMWMAPSLRGPCSALIRSLAFICPACSVGAHAGTPAKMVSATRVPNIYVRLTEGHCVQRSGPCRGSGSRPHQQIGNDSFAWSGTTRNKSRLNFRDLLRAGYTGYVVNDAAELNARARSLGLERTDKQAADPAAGQAHREGLAGTGPDRHRRRVMGQHPVA